MLSKTNPSVAWICAVCMAMGSAAMAQTPAPCTTPVGLGALSLAEIPKVGAPYSATVTTTQDKKLADGSVVHGSVTTYQARVRQEERGRKGHWVASQARTASVTPSSR